MRIIVYSEEDAIELSGEFMKIARAIKEKAHFRESLEETILCDSLYNMRDSISVLRPEIIKMAKEKAEPKLEPESVMTEQDFWDEYMRLCSLQTGENGSKGFVPSDSICDRVKRLMEKMEDAGMLKNKSDGGYFRNWFFKCKGNKFRVCIYRNGKTELRWG